MDDKTIGIIGGMGPEATIDLMRRIIELTPAQDDADHIRMLVDNNPKIPSRIKAIIEKQGTSPAPILVKMAQNLEQNKVDILAIPCNTAHYYYNEIDQSVEIPVLNILDIASKNIHKKLGHIKKIGLLASSATQIISLFEPYFNNFGIEIIYPNDEHQDHIMELIRSIKASKYTTEQVCNYQLAAANLVNKGAQALLVSCTELSILQTNLEVNVPVFDTAQLLAEEIVNTVKRI